MVDHLYAHLRGVAFLQGHSDLSSHSFSEEKGDGSDADLSEDAESDDTEDQEEQDADQPPTFLAS